MNEVPLYPNKKLPLTSPAFPASTASNRASQDMLNSRHRCTPHIRSIAACSFLRSSSTQPARAGWSLVLNTALHGGGRGFHDKSTCTTQLTLGRDVVQTCQVTVEISTQRNPSTPRVELRGFECTPCLSAWLQKHFGSPSYFRVSRFRGAPQGLVHGVWRSGCRVQ